MYKDGLLTKYLDDLAAKKPAPGGGSAAALEGAIGCALISMVANFTISNKKYENVKGEAAEDLAKSEKVRNNLTALIDRDVKAYGLLSAAFKDKEADKARMQGLYKSACDVPFEICRLAGEAITIARRLIDYGNKNLITDTAIAALMLESAFFGAKFNVYINLRDIDDDEYIERIHTVLSGLGEEIPKLKEEILHRSEEVILK